MNNEEAQARLDKITKTTSRQQAESDRDPADAAFLNEVERRKHLYCNAPVGEGYILSVRDILLYEVSKSTKKVEERLQEIEQRKPQKHLCACEKGGLWTRKDFSVKSLLDASLEEQNLMSYGEWIATLKHLIEGLQTKVKELRLELQAVKTKGIEYKGVYQRALSYAKGDVVTADGSCWVCLGDPKGAPAKDFDGWQLLIKGVK